MRNRVILALVLLAQCVGGSCLALAGDVYVQLFPLTGEIQLRNKNASAFSFAYYSIGSSGSFLNGSPSIWKSISGTYDDNGNGFIDPTHSWNKLSSIATELAEGAFSGPGGTLPANRAISLGQIWNPIALPDLVVEVQDANELPASVTIEYALSGDYWRDGVVNQLDYDTWRQNFGSSLSLDADGNLNGVVDAGDYVIWRDNFGNSIPSLAIGAGSGAALIFGAAIPEPPAAVLLGLAIAIALSPARPARRGAARRHAVRR
ncbi:MAG: hypothetical protein WD468_06035 [Pirellulales bacterium]